MSGRGSNHSWGARGGVVNNKDGGVLKIRKTGHEGVPEMVEVHAVAHFVG
jgi:hypothetical protein